MRIIERLRETRLTGGDVVYLVMRGVVACSMIYFLGPLWGLVTILFSNYMLDWTICRLYRLQMLNFKDRNVWYDQESNRC